MSLDISDSQYFDVIKNSDISLRTKTTYMHNLKKIIRCCNQPLSYIILHPETQFDLIKKCFSANSNDTVFFTVIGSLMAAMKWSKISISHPEIHQKWTRNYFQPLSKRVSEQRETNLPTIKQEKSRLTWSKVLSTYKKFKRNNWGSIDLVFLSMCVLIPVRRQADYSKVLISHDANQSEEEKSEGTTGWIDMYLEKPQITIHVYKTSKTYNKWIKEIPDKLLKVIKKSLEKHPRNYLLVNNNNKPWNSVNSFTQYYNRFLKKVFNNPAVSLNSLRHSYASHLQTLNLSIGERRLISTDMGHSLETNMIYVFKPEKKDKKKIKINGKKYYLTPAE